MAEPHSTVIAGALYGASLSSVSVFFGARVDLLVAGLVAAILVSVWLEDIDTKRKAAAAGCLSSLLAGYGSPVAAEWMSSSVPSISTSDSLLVLLALVIGATSPTVVPIAIRAFGKKVGGKL